MNDDTHTGPSGSQSKDRLVIALDFGTTFSGIAYAFTRQRKPEIVSIMDWPGLEGRSQPKVPTIIHYDTESPGGFTWGGQKHNGDVVHGVKLLLDPDQPRPTYLPKSSATSDLMRLRKPAVDATADFIKAIYQHAMVIISSETTMAYLNMCQKQFVLSVPAVWSDRAKHNALMAAKRAGIHPVTLIKEPEAAAMYTIHKFQDKALEVGDTFVVCDAGGGTVDLISYEIISLKVRLELKELVPGSGGMVGSLCLNKRFEEAVKDVVGEDQYSTLSKTEAYEKAVSQFNDLIKTAFRGSSDEKYFVHFPMAKLSNRPKNNLIDNCWNMKGDDIKAIFDPIVADIEELVNNQVKRVRTKRMSEGHPKAHKIKAIFLVGGFGASQYLKSRIEKAQPDIQVIQPHDAWSAIVKGAVLSQFPLEASIVSTQSPRHYGVAANSIYEDKDKGQKWTWDQFEGVHRVEKMTWYIRRGEDLKRQQVIKFPFCRKVKESYSVEDLIFEDKLIQSESETPPIYPSPLTTSVNCVLMADLRSVDRKNLSRRIGYKGTPYYNIDFNLVVTIQPAMMKFSLEVDGKEMGSVSAQYE